MMLAALCPGTVFISSKNYAWENDNNLLNFHAKLAVSYPINYAIKNTKNE
jgi:hypothetical protein